MWLLDHNVPRSLQKVLVRLGIQSRTAVEEGWDFLENGKLLAKAVETKYEAILTRDKRFQIDATLTFKNAKDITIVLLILPQSDAKTYCAEFEKAWAKSPIVLNAGTLVEWPGCA